MCASSRSQSGPIPRSWRSNTLKNSIMNFHGSMGIRSIQWPGRMPSSNLVRSSTAGLCSQNQLPVHHMHQARCPQKCCWCIRRPHDRFETDAAPPKGFGKLQRACAFDGTLSFPRVLMISDPGRLICCTLQIPSYRRLRSSMRTPGRSATLTG